MSEPGDRDLVRLYWPLGLRPAFDALFAIDDALRNVVATSSQPALGAIRLAWWRDALERLDRQPPPAEPRLSEAATQLLPRGVKGAELAGLAEAWGALFDEERDPRAIGARGEILFAIAGRMLGESDEALAQAGRWFALGDVARHHLAPALERPSGALRFSAALRPLTALACLAVRDLRHGEPFEPEATPGRAFALLRHRWSGRIRAD